MMPVDQAWIHGRPVDLSRVANQISGAGEELPGRADEKVSMVLSELMNGLASKPGELSSWRWTAGPNAPEVSDLVE